MNTSVRFMTRLAYRFVVTRFPAYGDEESLLASFQFVHEIAFDKWLERLLLCPSDKQRPGSRL